MSCGPGIAGFGHAGAGGPGYDGSGYGGSARYLEALLSRLRRPPRLATPIVAVRPKPDHMKLSDQLRQAKTTQLNLALTLC